MGEFENRQAESGNEGIELKKTKQRKPGISILGAIGLYLLFNIIIGLIVSIPFMIILQLKYFKENPVASAWIRIITQIVTYIVTIKLLLINVADRGIGKPSFVGTLRNNSKKKTLIGIVLMFGIGFFFISHNSVTLIQKYMTMPKAIEETFNELAVSPIVMLVFGLVVAPIFEEIICRGIFLEGFLKRYNQWVALIASAVLFGAIHMNWPQFLYASCLGLALGYVYMKTKSLILTIMLHALNNLASMINGGLNINFGDKFNIFYLALGIVFIVISVKYIDKYNSYEAEAKQVNFN